MDYRQLDPVAALREYSFWLDRSSEDARRSQAYRRAASIVESLEEDWQGWVAPAQWRALPGIGTSTAEFIAAVVGGRVPPKLEAARSAGAAPLDPAAEPLLGQLKGDLHTHTEASDGSAPIAEMAATAQALGRQYLAITDHSPRLRVANGLSRERLLAQWAELEQVQANCETKLLRGIEVDILKDGSLDQAPDLLAQTDIVVASVHSQLSAPSDEMTARMVAAVSNPNTTVLGHCTGRKLRADGTWRPQSSFDAEVVFAACAMFGVAVEINSRPERQDPPDELIVLAKDAGCLFAIDTDAHAPGQLDFLSYGAARAQKCAIAPDRIINSWPIDDLIKHGYRNRPNR